MKRRGDLMFTVLFFVLMFLMTSPYILAECERDKQGAGIIHQEKEQQQELKIKD